MIVNVHVTMLLTTFQPQPCCSNVHVHDCNCYSQDDCFTVTDQGPGLVSENMLFERLNASGMALTIESNANTLVRNITYRDILIKKTIKGIYLKVLEGGGNIQDVLIENVVIDSPEQFAIWLGPAQDVGGGGGLLVEGEKSPVDGDGSSGASSDGSSDLGGGGGGGGGGAVDSSQYNEYDICFPNPCSLCWPVKYAECLPIENGVFRNIHLRNILIKSPTYGSSLGVIMGSLASPIENLVLENVTIDKCGSLDDGNFVQTFPLIERGSIIKDPEVIKMVVLVIALVFIFLVVPLATLLSRTIMNAEWWKKKTKIKVVISLIVLGIVGTSFTPIFLWFSTVNMATYDEQDRTDYFYCDGVADSRAIGNTFPVPSCLQDDTVSQGGNLGGVCEVLEQWPWGIFTFFLIFMTAIYCYKHRKETARRLEKDKLNWRTRGVNRQALPSIDEGIEEGEQIDGGASVGFSSSVHGGGRLDYGGSRQQNDSSNLPIIPHNFDHKL